MAFREEKFQDERHSEYIGILFMDGRGEEEEV